jgi:hypothetical protein
MATKYPIRVRPGDDLAIGVTYSHLGTPIDLTGYTYEFKVGSTTYTGAPEVNVADPTTGRVVLALSAVQTALIADETPYYFRITGGGVATLLSGTVYLNV